MGCNSSQEKLIETLLIQRDQMRQTQNQIKQRLSQLQDMLAIRRNLQQDTQMEQSLFDQIKSTISRAQFATNSQLEGESDTILQMQQQILTLNDMISQMQKSQNQFFINKLQKYMRKNQISKLKTALQIWKLTDEFFDQSLTENSINITLPVVVELFEDMEMTEIQNEAQQEFSQLLQLSVIQEIYSSNKLFKGKVMNLRNSLRLFENMMDKKYSLDTSDIAQGKYPKDMGTYLVEYLTHTFGLKNIAYKSINQLIPALEIACKGNNSYLTIFARLIHVIHPQPIPYEFSLYLTKIRFEFNNLVESAAKRLPDKQKTALLAESKAVGGFVYLSDLISFIYNQFEQKQVRSHFLSLLRPQKIGVLQYFTFCIQNRMTKIGLVPENLFEFLSNGDSSVVSSVLIDYINSSLGFVFKNQYEQVLLKKLENKQKGVFKLKKFKEVFNLKEYHKNSKSIEYQISKCQFLLAITEVYQKIRLKSTSFVSRVFELNAGEVVDVDEFTRLLQIVKPNFPERYAYKMYEEALEDYGSIDRQAFCKILNRHSIGDEQLQIFQVAELYKLSKRQKGIASQASRETPSGSSSSTRI